MRLSLIKNNYSVVNEIGSKTNFLLFLRSHLCFTRKPIFLILYSENSVDYVKYFYSFFILKEIILI